MSRAANSVGFLRFFLASLVVWSHAIYLGGFEEEWLSRWSGGEMILGVFAVQAFFVLSGRLITESWIRLDSLPRFLWHRALRLLPALWICLTVTAFGFALFVFLFGNRGSFSEFFAQVPSPIEYVWKNLFLPRTQLLIGTLLSETPRPGDWNGSLWTLFYEGACYVGVAALGLAGLLSRYRRIGMLILAIFLLGFLAYDLRLVGPFAQTVGRLYDTPGKRLCLFFAAGGLWALAERAFGPIRVPAWLGFSALVILFFAWHTVWHRILSPFLIPPALFWLSDALPLRSWEARVGGDYSYGIYVFAYPLEQILAFLRCNEWGFPLFVAAAYGSTLVFAVASWRFVEHPCLQWKHLVGRRTPRAGRPAQDPIP